LIAEKLTTEYSAFIDACTPGIISKQTNDIPWQMETDPLVCLMTTGSAGSALINRPSTGRWTNALIRGMKIGWKSKRQPSDSAIISAGRRAIRATLIDLHAPECASTHIQLPTATRRYHNPPNNAGPQSMGPLSNSPSVCKCIATG
jgi:hypothetical protein